jgi:hypothetical protein
MDFSQQFPETPLPLQSILQFSSATLVGLSHRADSQSLPLAQWMYDHGMDKLTAVEALDTLCAASPDPSSMALINWIIDTYHIRIDDIDVCQDGYCECIISACLNGNIELVHNLVDRLGVREADLKDVKDLGYHMMIALRGMDSSWVWSNVCRYRTPCPDEELPGYLHRLHYRMMVMLPQGVDRVPNRDAVDTTLTILRGLAPLF